MTTTKMKKLFAAVMASLLLAGSTAAVTAALPQTQVSAAEAQTIKVTSTTVKGYPGATQSAQFASIKATSSTKSKITYKKISGNSKIAVSTSGKIKVQSGLKAGTYAIKVQMTAASKGSYKAVSTTKTIKIQVLAMKSKTKILNCDGSGNGYYLLKYSDGSQKVGSRF